MTRILPNATDKLNAPSHSFLHRVISVDTDSPEQSIDIDNLGNTTIAGNLNISVINGSVINGLSLQTNNTPITIATMGEKILFDTASSGNYASFSTSLLTGRVEYEFPDQAGTFALTSDIPDVSVFVKLDQSTPQTIGLTGARLSKLWATDIESTNMPTVGGTAILTSLTAPQFTTIELGHASDTTLSRVSAGVISVEGKTILTSDNIEDSIVDGHTKIAPSGNAVFDALDAKASLTGAETITNKRITSRITTITSHATPTINTDNCDAVTITAQAEDITSMTTNLSGTPTNFQKLIIRIKDNGTARAITWGDGFEAKGVALPTTTVISKVLTVGFIYDTVTSKWGCVAVAQEA